MISRSPALPASITRTFLGKRRGRRWENLHSFNGLSVSELPGLPHSEILAPLRSLTLLSTEGVHPPDVSFSPRGTACPSNFSKHCQHHLAIQNHDLARPQTPRAARHKTPASYSGPNCSVTPVGRTTARGEVLGAGVGAVRDVRNNEKEGGQTNESLKTSAAHAADAARDAAAADWEETGSHRGGAGRERDRERGAAPRPLWAREPTLPPGATRPPRPRADVNSPGRPERSLQTSSRRGVPGVGGRRAAAAAEPQPRPAPRPSAAHLGQVYEGAPLAPRRSCPPRPRGPGLARRPHLRGPGRPPPACSPVHPLARPRPLASLT